MLKSVHTWNLETNDRFMYLLKDLWQNKSQENIYTQI